MPRSGSGPIDRRLQAALCLGVALFLAGCLEVALAAAAESLPSPPSPTETLLHAEVPPCNAAGEITPAPAALLLPDALAARRLLFMRGKCALTNGQLAEAEAIFRQGLTEDKDLPRLWRLYLFRTLMRQGKHIEALATLAETLRGASRSYVKERIRQALYGPYLLPAPSAQPSAGTPPSPASAEDVEFDYLSTYIANVRVGADDYDLMQRLLALAAPRHDDALLKRLPVLLWRYPSNEAAAQLGMTILGGKAASVKSTLKADDYTERARRLSDLRLNRLLALELGDVTLPALDADSARRLGRFYLGALLQLKAYRPAAELLERGQAAQRFAFDPKEVATWSVRVALRRRNTQQVLAYLKTLEALDGRAETLSGFYLELARQFEQRGDTGPMTDWCRRVIAVSPGSNAAGTAYWMIVWSRYQRNDLAGAQDWAEKALASTPPVPWDFQARLLYWKGRIIAGEGDAEGGRQAWSDLIAKWPSTYYGLVAQTGGDPISAKYAAVATRPEATLEAPKLDAVWKHPVIASALFAYAAGEDALAESLLQEALILPLSKDASRELAALFMVLNEHHLQQRLMANQGPYELVEAPIGNSPAWRQAFPPAFWDIVLDEASAQDVSPYFILAIMREESRFKVKADSRAGAKGLMQVMPSTALELARKRRISMDEAALLLPEFNIPIGALYLRDVLRRFDWNPIFAAAAYNAGPGAVMRWAKEWGEIPFDEFVERIPFDETQSYVRRVYSSYVIYRKLYP